MCRNRRCDNSCANTCDSCSKQGRIYYCGVDIDCLNIERGDDIHRVIKKIGDKVCQIANTENPLTYVNIEDATEEQCPTGGVVMQILQVGSDNLVSEHILCNGVDNLEGDSAYEIWLSLGNTGTEQDFIDSLNGQDGVDGADGKSAYEIWIDEGNTGTEQDFLDSLEGVDGTDGSDGLSAYEIWLNLGNSGSEQDFINSLEGTDGIDGVDGINGTFNIEYISYSDLLTLRNSSGLFVGTMYSITDNGVHLLALLNNQLATEGLRVMRIVKPEYYVPATGVLGVWNNSISPNVNDVCVWGGRVWENNTGNVGTATSDLLLSSDWSAVSVNSSVYYSSKIFGCNYDIDNNWVSSQWDDRGNIFTLSYDLAQLNLITSYNIIDHSDWGDNRIFDNLVWGVMNNSSTSVFGNSNKGVILNNSNSLTISYNNNNGGIINNSNTGVIFRNINNGRIEGIGSANSNIQLNTNNGVIIVTTSGTISDTLVNK